MKKIWMILCLIFIASFTLSSCNQAVQTDDIWEQVRSAPVVKLESAQQNEEPIFVDNTGSVTAIADMRIQPSDQTFDEEWIYRFSYNPHEKVLDSQEIVILFGSSSLSAMEPPICRKRASPMTAYWNGRKACIKVTFHKQTTNGGIFPVRPFFMRSTFDTPKQYDKDPAKSLCRHTNFTATVERSPVPNQKQIQPAMSFLKIHLTFIRGYAILLYID